MYTIPHYHTIVLDGTIVQSDAYRETLGAIFSTLWLLELILTVPLRLILGTKSSSQAVWEPIWSWKDLWKVLDRFRSFFKGEEGVSAAPPIAEPVLKAESGSLMVDEDERSTKLEDLNVEDWPLEDSFNVVSDFPDSMPGNSRVTEPAMNLRASSPSSVSSPRMSFLHETSSVFRLIRQWTKS